MRVAIELSQEQAERLRDLAGQFGLGPNALVQARVIDALNQPDEEFERAAEYVLQKNRELYRRLV